MGIVKNKAKAHILGAFFIAVFALSANYYADKSDLISKRGSFADTPVSTIILAKLGAFEVVDG